MDDDNSNEHISGEFCSVCGADLRINEVSCWLDRWWQLKWIHLNRILFSLWCWFENRRTKLMISWMMTTQMNTSQ